MIITLRLFLLFCVTFSEAFGQTQKLILTIEQNNKWIDSLKTLTPDKQLTTIKERLLADTNVFVRKFYPDGIKVVDHIGNRVYGDGKPTFIIGGYSIFIDNKTETNKIVGLTQLLTKEYIKQISILSGKDPATTAIYGSSGLSGIIVMTLTKEKYLKRFRQFNSK